MSEEQTPKKTRKKRVTATSTDTLVTFVIQGMQDLKAEEITLVDLRHLQNAMADYFVICSGTSDTHIDSISDSVKDAVIKQCGEYPFSVEGKTNREWILLDYSDVVVHVFKKDRREFYGLEQLWGDAKITEIKI